MATPLTMTKPVSTVQTLAARLSIASGVLLVFLLAGVHMLEPEFDPTWRFVSEYALGPFGLLMHLAFLMLATSLASAGVVLFPYVRSLMGKIGRLVGYLGLALLLGIVFLMTTKPELVGSLIVMAVTLALGLLSSVLVSRMRRTPRQEMAAQKAEER